ncbi:MAG: nucleotidyltransferase domain-containing protein [Methanobrevibacter sp. CfCl-M3]
MIYILDEEMEIVLNILKIHINDCEVFVFGSRVKGRNKPFSDLDLAFKCKEKISLERKFNLEIAFEDSNLPYNVDVVDYNRASENFQKIIDSNSKKIFG